MAKCSCIAPTPIIMWSAEERGSFVEAHFWQNGYVNSRNSVHWNLERPWWSIAKAITLEEGHSSASNVPRERSNGTIFLLETFLAKLWQRQDVNMQRVWFQQDGATPHTSQMALNWLRDHYCTRVIRLNTRHVWAPKSSDVNPLDFFAWGCIISFKDPPNSKPPPFALRATWH